MVLEEDSSVLGYLREISKPLDADHHGVCKYESLKDPRYVTVRNVLKSLVGKAQPKGKSLFLQYAQSCTILTQLGTAADDLGGSAIENLKFNFEEYLSIPESHERDYNFF